MHSESKFCNKNEAQTGQDPGCIPFSERKKEVALFHIAKTMLRFSSKAEEALWQYLKAQHKQGMTFQRLHPVGRFIADFVNVQKKIIIEIDNNCPAEDPAQGVERNIWFKAYGYKVLRFLSSEVSEDINGVIEQIKNRCLAGPSLNPFLLFKGKRRRPSLCLKEDNSDFFTNPAQMTKGFLEKQTGG
ncbi:MAG: DUF559 domain-containing protein [Candidatus Omnitrophica bacterium]|nr:DUF559 domain-containing protein [Candidatus Omnitrophota bacterium]